MELFLDNGHLTDEGLQEIINETLNELQRLEAAEHLSFCDDCLMHYASMVDNAQLYTPQQPLLAPTKARIRQRIVKVVFSKYATAAAAVVFAVTLTAAGVFSTSNFTAIGNAISLQGIFNTNVVQYQEAKVPQQPKVKIPEYPQVKVAKAIEVAKAEHKKKETEKRKVEENPAKKVAQQQNPLLEYLNK